MQACAAYRVSTVVNASSAGSWPDYPGLTQAAIIGEQIKDPARSKKRLVQASNVMNMSAKSAATNAGTHWPADVTILKCQFETCRKLPTAILPLDHAICARDIASSRFRARGSRPDRRVIALKSTGGWRNRSSIRPSSRALCRARAPTMSCMKASTHGIRHPVVTIFPSCRFKTDSRVA